MKVKIQKRNYKNYIIPIVLILVMSIIGIYATGYLSDTRQIVGNYSVNQSGLYLYDGSIYRSIFNFKNGYPKIKWISYYNNLNDEPLIHLENYANITDNYDYYMPLKIDNYGNGTAMQIYQNGRLSYHQNGLDVTSAYPQNESSQGLVNFRLTSNLSTDNVLQVWNEGIGLGIEVQQKGDREGLKVTSTAKTTTSYSLASYGQGGAVNGFFRQDKNQTNIEVNKQATGIGSNLLLKNYGTGTNLELVSYGDGRSLFVNQDYNAVGINIDTEATTSSNYGLEIYAQKGATNFLSRQDGNYSNVIFAKTATGSGVNVNLGNSGTGTNLYLNQDGDGYALDLDSESTTYPAVKIQDTPSNKSITIEQNDKFCFDGITCLHYLSYNGTCITNGTTCIG